MSALTWTMRRLGQLEPLALHAVLALRADVFVVEQRCAFLDPDVLDLDSWHLLGEMGGALVAYLRLVDPGRKYAEPSIGRVVTRISHRGQGLGVRLMQEGIVQARGLWPEQAIRIGAQRRLQVFYERLGFRIAGPVYIEDEIEHVEMLLAGPIRAQSTTRGDSR